VHFHGYRNLDILSYQLNYPSIYFRCNQCVQIRLQTHHLQVRECMGHLPLLDHLRVLLPQQDLVLLPLVDMVLQRQLDMVHLPLVGSVLLPGMVHHLLNPVLMLLQRRRMVLRLLLQDTHLRPPHTVVFTRTQLSISTSQGTARPRPPMAPLLSRRPRLLRPRQPSLRLHHHTEWRILI
jgi:hypothetical protein